MIFGYDSVFSYICNKLCIRGRGTVTSLVHVPSFYQFRKSALLLDIEFLHPLHVRGGSSNHNQWKGMGLKAFFYGEVISLFSISYVT